jgi:hypothetical protein
MDVAVRVMVRRWLKRLLALCAFAGVGYAGYFVGFHLGLQESYFNNVIHTGNYIYALNKIHENKLDYASEALETDLSLSVLLSPTDDAMLLPHTRERVQETLSKVKAYRLKHPWKSGQSFDRRVEDTLSRVKAEEEKSCP